MQNKKSIDHQNKYKNEKEKYPLDYIRVYN